VTNAAKFGALAKLGGQVSVTWRREDGGSVKLCWRESGGPPVTPPKRRGFGSTLIERALAMETGGHATLSYARGGVACDVFLPASAVCAAEVTDAEPAAHPPVPAESATAAATPLRVLVVEDSSFVLLGLEAVFDHLGWVIVGPATRRDAALALAASAAFDVALLDVNLDGELSWDAAAVVRGRGIPIVFGTGYNVQTVLPEAFRGTPTLSKPFSLVDLEQALRRAAAHPRAGSSA